jgi:hypothetical protein
MPQYDPRIYYLVGVPDISNGVPTILQGFSPSLCFNAHLVRAAAFLPSTIYEFVPEFHKLRLPRKICGLLSINWHPQSPEAILAAPGVAEVPFMVLLLDHDQNPADFSGWARASVAPPTIVAREGGDLSYEQLTLEGLKARLLKVCDQMPTFMDQQFVEEARRAIALWEHPPMRPLGYTVGGHATVTPNLMALDGLGFDEAVHGRFNRLKEGIAPYVEQIVRTTRSVLSEREKIDSSPYDHTLLRSPDLNIFAPSISPEALRLRPPQGLSERDKQRFKTAVKILHDQTGYNYEIRSDRQNDAIVGGPLKQLLRKQPKLSPHPLILLRQRELALSTEVVGALAASELSATVRLPNDVNRTIGVVRQFANHYRSARRHPHKMVRAFQDVQRRIGAATPSEFKETFAASKDGIRIISDAHVEWLDMDGVPLGIRKNVSRIPVTPGNLFVRLLTDVPLLRLTADAFRQILVVSALRRADPIRGIFEFAFGEFAKVWRDALTVKFVDVASEEQFVSSINSFEGSLMIFDGHGSHPPNSAGVLHLQDARCDVWHLKGKLDRLPPIVLLSACDTHASDRNHATTANGFLSLGARAVLASVLPLNAGLAALFMSRLIYRIAAFVPASIGLLGRSLSWTEIVSGMLRMQLISEFLIGLHWRDLLDEPSYMRIAELGNSAVNQYAPDPFNVVFDALVDQGLQPGAVQEEWVKAVAQSSAISYLNMGRPETIMLDREDRLARVKQSVLDG